MKIAPPFHRLLRVGYYAASSPYRIWLHAQLAAKGTLPILVLFYHRIADDGARLGTHSNQQFRKQIHWLKHHCDLISLEEAQRRIRSGYNDRLAACITFDDGYSQNCDQAIPFLIDQQIPCTYFVSSWHVLSGRPFAHDVDLDCPPLPNTLEQLRWMAMSASRSAHIPAHTLI